ncbi:MAG: 30S ribosomal protein S18 [Candidatus Yanofskybacteria bacterium RIFCSPLOWO2_02_FULL_45_10]|uniref:30S ribosomal protein S18 n=2 Tax=Candidatus Yanofskyibacteriota TaxID=1752733 RepID=A0A1F8G5W2_9BACT|nr:MAG: 30S ribosomal protein S18 [Candidatus Yanofskybacteria bacterium RIFCSPHIGHO2_12_FULL_45_19b]OGN31808.1 MAG: 30S ribosomal protein S18 [Candidatus Yanofskybacteria bacterium RIFCSPLOWO2_02_FULL_45_10]
MPCICCQEKIDSIDYKETKVLQKFTTGQFKIITGQRTGLCPKHQRQMTKAIKLARFMALMPYTRKQTRK